MGKSHRARAAACWWSAMSEQHVERRGDGASRAARAARGASRSEGGEGASLPRVSPRAPPASAPPRPATPASSARPTTSAPQRRDSSRIARDPATAGAQTEQKAISTASAAAWWTRWRCRAGQRAAHRVTHIAADSQQHRRFPSHQHDEIGHRPLTVCVFSDVRSLAFHHTLGGMCLCSFRPVRVLTLLRGSALGAPPLSPGS
jgi:hypothetical protein